MAILTTAVPMKGGRQLRGRATLAGGKLALTLSPHAGGYRFKLVAQHLDLSTIDTGNGDLTVALVVDGANFVQNRNLTGNKKNVFTLPRKGKSKKAKA
jgi:hypothetical protein